MTTDTPTTTPSTSPQAASRQGAGAKARDAIAGGVGPLADKARGFAKQCPFAAAALAGVVGIAILNTLRGRR